MDVVQSQLAAAIAERDRIEADVSARHLDGAPIRGRRDLLPYLMGPAEFRHWRAVIIAIEELEKHQTH